ncbi:Leucine-responsive regulatory protein [Pseudoruegeria aquimaris]|uniref:Leucine-responsive regulatory protein n=1 Tax=Pseudoruegeria aquimaris TaxID=393663 RepID=A0A1Y5SRS0_9RHOB|nr:Lrp/AsnC family transcriptional regulator [Pseudoruegeria aquimaris]SLN45071.1 Leucine-responsive regulatory protein [Pseudoruegeria aquimaris]
MEFSDQDIRILREVQRDSSASLAELSERCRIPQSTLWRRLNDLEAAGLVKGRVALLDPAKLHLKLVVFANVSLRDHSEQAVSEFAAVVSAHPEIMECHAVSGASDYILKIRVRDVEAYERFMTHTLLRNRHVGAVHSSFGLRELKYTTQLPI